MSETSATIGPKPTVLPFLRRAAGAEPTSGMVAFLFTDIVGSTRRWEEQPDAMRLALARHDAILRSAVLGASGHVFRTLGDSFMAAFSTPQDAARAAVLAQRQLVAAEFLPVGGLNVRMAIYAGIVEARDGDYFGQAPNRTARLLSATHGAQILIAGTAGEMVEGQLPPGAELVDLGRHRLRDLPHAERVWQIVAPGLPALFPPILTLARVGNLPQHATSFIGREDDVHAVASRLERSRIVSIAGAGGLGKTRLALEVASRARSFGDGAWFVELAAVADPALVAEAVCVVVGAATQGAGEPIDRLVTHLRGRQALLILDNCEHVVGAAAEIAHRVLRECAGPSVLVTSREALGVPGEEVWRVAGLSVPRDDEELAPDDAQRYGAVQLFLDRARAVAGADLALDAGDMAAVANICRRLDGIPLALELAAARVKVLGVRQLSARIGDRFRLLTGGARVLLARQQTLTALYDWSYNLLDAREQTLFRRMSVFAGGATLARICELCGCCGDELEALDVIGSLVEKSLVVADDSTETTRYRMLETTRDYAWSKLREADETMVARDMTLLLARVFSKAHRDWPTAATQDWLDAVMPDIDNLRFALDWSLAQGGDVSAGLELLSWSLRAFDEASLLEERRRWFTLGLERLSPDAEPALAARLWFGQLSLIAHGDRTNVEPARRAAELFGAAGDEGARGESLARVGAALLTPASVADAAPWLAEAHAILTRIAPGKPLATCLRSIALARSFAQDSAAARPLVEESMEIMRRIGDRRGVAAGEITLAEICYSLGEVDDAIRITRDLIDSNRPNRRQLTVALGNLAGYLLSQDRIDEARFVVIEGLREARAVGHSGSIARLVEHAALIAALVGDGARAARLLGYGGAFYALGAASREFTEETALARSRALIAAALPAAVAARLESEGSGWSENDAIVCARAVASVSRAPSPAPA